MCVSFLGQVSAGVCVCVCVCVCLLAAFCASLMTEPMSGDLMFGRRTARQASRQ